jgi:uncharacterized membrane protein
MRRVIILIAVLAIVLWASGTLTAGSQAAVKAAQSAGTLEIVVLDENGKPLPGAQVSLAGHRAATDKEGSCKFEVLPGRYPVLIRKDGYKGRRLNLGVRPGEITSQQVQLQKLTPPRPPKK